MSQKELNLGILAHVDAGKTTLTERLLYEAGVISEVGSVDAGTTQTDSLSLERERGITIRSAVTSFPLEDVHVNLIDTPGHPDFIAEVERVLSVLDGAVLVISAVEGVQPQTRILMSALKRLQVPTIFFVNKIDRRGATAEAVLRAISQRLTPAVVPMGEPRDLGTRAARFLLFNQDDPAFVDQASNVLAEHDERVLATYLEDEVSKCSDGWLTSALALQTGLGLVHPVFFGSAITGSGVAELMGGIREFLPAADGDADGPLSAKIFKIERSPRGEKIAYARLFSGTLQTRQNVPLGTHGENKVTAIAVFETGSAVQRGSVSAGGVAQLWGLEVARVGDTLGVLDDAQDDFQFPPPTLESIVVPKDTAARSQLAHALNQLAEQDPLIDVRQDDLRHEISVSLYGEVQQQVIATTLEREYGVEVSFREPTPICIERVVGSGTAVEALGDPTNPFLAGLGFRVERAATDSGVDVDFEVDLHSIPLYVYKAVPSFEAAIEEYVRATLEEGLAGWQVTDCRVTLTHCDYSSPGSSARDYRRLTPLVLMQALNVAGTQVCEPYMETKIETPSEWTSNVLSAVTRSQGGLPTVAQHGRLASVVLTLPARELSSVRRTVPGLTAGEGLVDASFAGYEPVVGPPLLRPRRTLSALNRDEYLMHLAGRARGSAHDS